MLADMPTMQATNFPPSCLFTDSGTNRRTTCSDGRGDGGAKAIRVLSPFYENDAWGILELCWLLECKDWTTGSFREGGKIVLSFDALNENEITVSAAVVEARGGRIRGGKEPKEGRKIPARKNIRN